MLGAAVILGVLFFWLSRNRLQYTWRMGWISAAVVAICAASMAAGGKLMGWIAGGIFVLARGVAHLIMAI